MSAYTYSKRTKKGADWTDSDTDVAVSSFTSQEKQSRQGEQAMLAFVILAVLALIAVIIWMAVDFATKNAYMEIPSSVSYKTNPDGSWQSVATFSKQKNVQVVCQGRGDVVESCTQVPRSADEPTPRVALSLDNKPLDIPSDNSTIVAAGVGTNPAPVPIAATIVTNPIAATGVAVTGNTTGYVLPVASTPVMSTPVASTGVMSTTGQPNATFEGPAVVANAPLRTGPISGPVSGPGAPYPATLPVVPPYVSPAAQAASKRAAAQQPPPKGPYDGVACHLNPQNVNQALVQYTNKEYENATQCVPRQFANQRLNNAEVEGAYSFDQEDCAAADGVFDIPSVKQQLGACTSNSCGPGELAWSGLEVYDVIPCEDTLTLGLTNASRRSANDVVPVGAESWIDQDQISSRHEELAKLQLGGFLPFQMVKRSDVEPLDSLPFSYNIMEGTAGQGGCDDFNQVVQTDTPEEKLSKGTFRHAVMYGTKDGSRVAQSSNPYVGYANNACTF